MRILHTMIRVTDLDKSLDFYTNIFGMQQLSRKDFPDGRFTLAFVGYGSDDSNTVLELTHNWDTKSYELGNAFGHIAIAVQDAYKACDDITAKGGKVVALSDCEPDIASIKSALLKKAPLLLVKLSPMLDITLALMQLPETEEVHIVSVDGECKELLLHRCYQLLFSLLSCCIIVILLFQ